jgi:hypothetical protein
MLTDAPGHFFGQADDATAGGGAVALTGFGGDFGLGFWQCELRFTQAGPKKGQPADYQMLSLQDDAEDRRWGQGTSLVCPPFACSGGDLMVRAILMIRGRFWTHCGALPDAMAKAPGAMAKR